MRNTREAITNISVIGCRNRQFTKEVKHAAAFMLEQELGKRLFSNVFVRVDVVSGLLQSDGVYGDVQWDDDENFMRPREYTIRIHREHDSSKEFYSTLAHEIIHVRQWAKNEMYEFQRGSGTRFRGKIYDSDNMHEDDYPWEKEAYAKQQKLCDSYLAEYKVSNIKNFK